MAGIGPEDLHALAEELLSACIEALDTIPTYAPGLGGAPERTFIAAGTPVWDCCEQLAVHVSTLTESSTSPGGLGSGRRASFGRVNLIRLVATVTRCIPTINDAGELPSEVELTEAAEQVNADGWALWNHIYNLIREEQLFSLCSEVFWDGFTAANPSGGCAGWTLSLRVQMDGYEEILGS